ncbi:MAG: hypothetical protein U0175_17885 [Caldilineaceae bacterium]
MSARWIALLVAVLYFGSSLFIFRGVAASIPSILRGDAVINGDELVPFFNPTSQLIDQAAGKFNQLTNGYEFRVRYAILTTWVRYYKVLPFAIILVIPGVTYAAYLATSRFLTVSLATPVENEPEEEVPEVELVHQKAAGPFSVSPTAVYVASAMPVALIFLILTYSKVTHFYTLVLGFSMFLIAAAQLTQGLIFEIKHPYRNIANSCIITLLNPAVHYLILFALYLSMTVASLVLLEIIVYLSSGAVRNLFPLGKWRKFFFPLRQWWPYCSPKGVRQIWGLTRYFTLTRCIMSFVLLGFLTLIPYGLFVKFYALRGVPNLSETVPGDFYFITDASISYDHLLAFDMAGIMDKMISGDYLAKDPRYPNAIYTILLFVPLLVPACRRQVFNSWPRRQFMVSAYFNVFFSMWATLGYSKPEWMPTFHRTIAFISLAANDMQSTLGDLIIKLTSTIVQVLRFPHRFELILFMMACLLLPITVLWMTKQLERWLRSFAPQFSMLVLPFLTLIFLVPLFSSWQYRTTFSSGDFGHFLAPYPVAPLKEVKNVLEKMPPGKVVVLPPTETAKIIEDISGVEHKFIDKFHIYYLDLPSYYYGLTGDSDNKFEFFLLLRGLYYQQDWWINISRDLDLRYIVINKELIANTMGGAEYLREIEKVVIPELDHLTDSLRKIFENDSYVVYEAIDLPRAPRPPLLLDTSWNTFMQLLSRNLNLTRYYDLRHLVVSDDLTNYPSLTLLTDDVHAAMLDLHIKANPDTFFGPSSSIFAFQPAIVPSSYYLSPMFRLFQFFSDSKWNRLNMITPGLFGTIRGSFIGLPQISQFRIDAKFPEAGKYRILLRGAATVNNLEVTAKKLGFHTNLELKATPDSLAFFDSRTVFDSNRTPLDVSQYSTEELAKLIPSEIVAVNYRYQYFDVGVVDAPKGSATFYFDKKDGDPLLVEGILLIPEDSYQNLTLPKNVHLVQSLDELCCKTLNLQTDSSLK